MVLNCRLVFRPTWRWKRLADNNLKRSCTCSSFGVKSQRWWLLSKPQLAPLKTEIARNILALFVQQREINVIHINNDEYRAEFSGYKGINSPLFQGAATIFVEAVHDRALKRNVSFIMDTTLSSYEKAQSNISRSLARNREVLNELKALVESARAGGNHEYDPK